MPLIKRIAKRNIRFTIIFFAVFLVITASYLYLSYNSETNTLNTSINIIKDSINQGIFNSIKQNISGMYFLFTVQVVLFILSVLSLLLVLWHTYQLYLIQLKNALVDSLTGIYNRRAVFHELKNELKRAQRYNHPTSVAMIDIDFFKKYNDTLGHVAGDKLLKRFKNIFEKIVREYDVFGRYGGEEFIIIFPRTKLKDAAKVCERLRNHIEKLSFYGESKLPNKNVTVSIGVAEYKGKGKIKREMIIERADEKLYKAKEQGRNRVVS